MSGSMYVCVSRPAVTVPVWNGSSPRFKSCPADVLPSALEESKNPVDTACDVDEPDGPPGVPALPFCVEPVETQLPTPPPRLEPMDPGPFEVAVCERGFKKPLMNEETGSAVDVFTGCFENGLSEDF